jgi:hypothetical protein
MFVLLALAAQNLGVGLRRPYRRQVYGGGGPGAMARIAPPQPNEAMARIAFRFLLPQPNSKQLHFACPQRVDSFGVDSRFETARSSSAFSFFGLDSKLSSKVQIDSKGELG